MNNRRQTWFWWVGGALLALLILIGVLPSVVSSEWGNALILSQTNKRIDGTLSLNRLEVSWFGPQKVDHLELKDAKGKTLFKINRLESDTSLIALMFRKIGKTTLDHPYLDLVKDENDETNIEKVLRGKSKRKRKKSTKTPFRYPDIQGELLVTGGYVTLNSPKVLPVVISELEFTYKPEEDIFHIGAKTQQQSVEGSVLASGTLSKQIHMLAQIHNFPVAILDQLRDKTFYTTAIGETLDCKIETTKEAGGYTLSADISSVNLNGVISGKAEGGRFTVTPSSQLTYTLTPQTFKAMIGPQQKLHWSLASRSDLSIRLKEVQFPLEMEALDFSDMQLNIDVTMDRAEVIHNKIGPYSLNRFKAQVLSKDDLELWGSAHLIGKEDSKISVAATLNEQKDVSYNLNAEGLPYALLELFFEEADLMHSMFGEMIALNIEGSCAAGKCFNKVNVFSPITKFEGEVIGATLSDLSFNVKGEHTLQDDLRDIFGAKVEFDVSGKAAVEQRSFAISTLTGKLSNPYFDVDLRGRIGERGKPFAYDQLRLTANGTLLQLPYQETFPDTKLTKGNFVVDLDGSKNRAVATGTMTLSVETEDGKIDSKASEVKVEMKDFIHDQQLDWNTAYLAFKASLQHFPVAVIEPLLPEGIDLLFLTGPIVNVQTHGTYTPQADDHLAKIELKANSEGFRTAFSVAVDGTFSLTQPQPAFIHWEITPERYSRLMKLFGPEKTHEYLLTQPATLDFQLKELTCPATSSRKLSHFLCQSGVVGNLSISPMVFSKGGEMFTIKGFQGVVKGENFSENIHLDLKSDLLSPNVPASESSTFSFLGDILNLWTHEGKLDRDRLTVKGEINLELMPVPQLTGIIPMTPESRKITRALLGELLNARITGEVQEMAGPVTVDIKSSNLKALLPLQLSPEFITLRNFVDAEISLTEEVSKDLLVDIFPLVKGATADHPLKLYIDPEGFSVAIRPFTFKGMTIPKAIVDIGKIHIINGGEIKALMEFLKVTEFSNDQWMEAWFTPIFISLEEGTSTYKRFDLLLAEKVHLAFWGRIDLVKDKIKMTMGIAPTTLMQRFNVIGISKNQMFQVKMRGKINNVELDWSSAYTRIGIIIARLAGGHLGYLVGGVIEQLISAFGDETTPPPTTQPFPWESRYPSEPGEHIPQEAPPPSFKKKGFKKALQFLAP